METPVTFVTEKDFHYGRYKNIDDFTVHQLIDREVLLQASILILVFKEESKVLKNRYDFRENIKNF